MKRGGAKLSLVSSWIVDRLIRVLIFVMRLLPYEARREVTAWFVAHVFAPLAGYRHRIRGNLALVFPDMPEPEVRRLTRAVPANIGRTFIELYSGDEFVARARHSPLRGPGVSVLEDARREGRPVILVTAHIGNYDAVRAALIGLGFPVGGLYKRMSNPFFNKHYVAAISRIGTPLFPRSRRGMVEMVRFLKAGGMVGMVLDHYVRGGVPLRFLGRDAITSLSAAELALRYNALVVPVYGIRRPDGEFDLLVGPPVPHGDPVVMTQALNDDLEVQVRQHMDQWMWTHRRWKGGRDA